MKYALNTVKVFLVFLIIWGINFSFVSITFAEVFFITNKTVNTEKLTKAEIRDLYLGREVKWPNGLKVKLVILKKSATHKEFVKNYTQKSTSQFKSWWKREVFLGRGSYPKSFNSEKKLIDYVSQKKGAVGYISSGVEIDGVKILEISDK